jgi:hypothetical protein
MPSRRPPRWCVTEISADGVRSPISPSFEFEDEAEERKQELLKDDKYRGKNLVVAIASYPVDPR